MKKGIKYKERELIMKCAEMSHSSVGGEYEIGFSEKIELNLENIWKKLGSSGYDLEEMNDRSLSLTYNNAVITILKKGRILIQDLLPDTFEDAIKIGEELISVEKESEVIKFTAILLKIALILFWASLSDRLAVRYGTEIEKRADVQSGVEIEVEDIREVEPGEIAPEEVPSDFEFDMRNYIKLSGYYSDLKDDPVINPNNILELEDYGFLGEINTQFKISYLENYQFKADVGYQISSGPGEQKDANTHFITNEFYFDLFVARLAYFKVGKKRETWGVGYTFSPVDDVLDWPKNFIDPIDSREGKYLALVEVPVGNSSFSFIIFPDVEFDLESESDRLGYRRI